MYIPIQFIIDFIVIKDNFPIEAMIRLYIFNISATVPPDTPGIIFEMPKIKPFKIINK